MNRRALTLLIAVLGALAMLAALVTLKDRPNGGTETLLLPGLKSELNDITQIVVKAAGNKTIATLKRGDESWVVVERNSYPADVGKIRKNLLALAEAGIVEEKTSNPEFYDRLGVQDIAQDSARGLQLELTGTKQPVSVIIGNAQAGGGDMTYVRRTGDATSWLVRGQFDPGRTAGEWLDRQLIDIPATRIQAITIDHPGLETLRIEKDKRDAPDFTVQGLPAGRQLSFPGVANAIGTVLATLQLDDVQPRDSLGSSPGKPVVARFATFDGIIVEASAWRVPDGTRITFTASTDKALADRFAAKESATPGFEDAVKQAAAINARLGAWVYTLPSYKTEQLTRRLQDLLAPLSSPSS